MSYLDDPRVLFAAERTLLAWQRTAIALMGFGFVIERSGVIVSPSHAAASGLMRLSLWVGVALLLLGCVVAAASALQFRRVLRTLGEREIPTGYWSTLGVWVNMVLVLAGIALAAHLLILA